MKYLKLFEQNHREAKIQSIVNAFKYNSKWEYLDHAEYPDAFNAFFHKLNKDFEIRVLFRKNKELISVSFYMYDIKEEQMMYLDNVETPYVSGNRYLRNSLRDIDDRELPDWCIKVGEKQMEYYNCLNKFPTENKMNDLISELIDFRWTKPMNEFDLIDLKFGYIASNFPTNEYDQDVYYHKEINSLRDPVYVAYLDSTTIAKEIFTKHSAEFKSGKDYSEMVKSYLNKSFDLEKRKIAAIYGLDMKLYTSNDFEEHNIEQLEGIMGLNSYSYRIIVTFNLAK